MNFPLSPATFRAPREVLVGETLAHLRLAGRLPLRVSCRCLAHWEDPMLEHLRFEHEAELGSCGDLSCAMARADTSVASGQIAADLDAALRLAPQVVIVLDADHCLVLAGDVQGGSIHGCAPVDGDAEARRVGAGACHLRAEARAAADDGDLAAADALRCHARAMKGHLVDPFWRELALSMVDQTLAV